MRLDNLTRILALTFSLSSLIYGSTLNNPSEAKEISNKVMIKVGEGDPESGLRILQPYLTAPVAEFEVMINNLRMQLPGVLQRYGKSIGYEFISQDAVGNNLLRIVYLHRFESHAMRWVFYFYRGKSGWILDTFKTDDDIRQLFPS